MRQLLLKLLIVALIGLAWPSPSQAQGTLTPVPQIVFLDAFGNPLNNGKICTYSAGTTTPLATYSDQSLMTANANPIRTNSAGRPTTGGIYLSATSYKFVVLTAGADNTCNTGTTVYTQDNVGAVPATAVGLDVSGTAGEALSAGDWAYLSDGSGALTAGRWYKADADNTYSSSAAAMIGVVPTAISSGAAGSIRIGGRITGLSGLSAGEYYYISATAGSITATPPTNQWFVGKADSTTTLDISQNQGGVRLPDSDGTHALTVKTTSDLTADRLFTLVPGDAARTLTLSGSPTLGDVSLASGAWFDTANTVIRRNTSDASDNGTVQVAGGGAAGSTRGADILINGNEASAAGDVLVTLGDVSGAQFRISNGTDIFALEESDGSIAATSSKQSGSFVFYGTTTTDATGTQVLTVRTGTANSGTSSRLIQFLDGAGGGIGHVNINNNAVAYTTSSDARLKTLIPGRTRWGLEALRRLKVRTFYFNSDEGRQVRQGFYAQELFDVYPEAVSVGGADPLTAPWSVEYGRLTPLLTQSMQELDAVMAGFEARLKALERENAELRARLGNR